MNINREHLSELDSEILIAVGFDDAIVGYVEKFGQNPVALYDRNKCIDILIKRDGMTEEEAEEFFEFNVIGSFVGEYTPAFGTFFDNQDFT